jgi:hypothetical protein
MSVSEDSAAVNELAQLGSTLLQNCAMIEKKTYERFMPCAQQTSPS